MALPLVQEAIARFGAGAEAFLAAFAKRGLGLDAYRNSAFINLIATVANADDAIRVFNALSDKQLALLYRLGLTRFGGLPIRPARAFSRLRYSQITLTQMLAYKFTSVRFTGPGGVIAPGLFNRQRSTNDNND
ncbi:hypothetical protein [Planktothricoides raciborskii]|uniref:Uncharacterized protein n=2 Tax=Planktothricoides raciborskii TaxID=132608 RepID=A0AAU8JDM6_9CYAN|nr:hypothetical protein [Planktothricoides raciborskii]MBD2547582.1 hypothetical protein [Planktothricoides raciborskii FACHB-1370]MBD2586186.1 hypothetical protein [Planktothricoides raciborskii FACHB-1261]